jgi:lipopolysaccharide transport system permease protein
MRHGKFRIIYPLKQLYKHRELLANMIYREIHGRYRQSLLGLAWTFLKPLFTISIVTLVFSVIVRVPSDDIPYPLFALGALLPWTLFSTALSSGVPSLTGQSNLVAKVYFPREILPLSAIAASVIEFLMTFLILVGLMIIYKVGLSWNALYIFLILPIELLFVIGVTLLLSMLNVWYRDIAHGIGLLLQLWMYLTPIVYPYSMVPLPYRHVYKLNPIVGIVEGFRSAMIKGVTPDLTLLAISFIISVVTFLVGFGVFKAYEFEFADVV